MVRNLDRIDSNRQPRNRRLPSRRTQLAHDRSLVASPSVRNSDPDVIDMEAKIDR
jgi:hypothetical protein